MLTKQHLPFTIAIACLVGFLFYISEALTPFIISLVISYLFLPTVNYFEKKGVSRSLVSAIIVISVTSLIIGFLIFLIPFVINKIMSLLQSINLEQIDVKRSLHSAIDGYLPFLSSYSKSIDGAINNFVYNFSKSLQQILLQLTAKTVKLANVVAILLCCPIICFYLLRDWHYLNDHIKGMIPRTYLNFYDNVTRDLNLNLSYYLHGQLQACLILAGMYSILLLISQLQFAIAMGILLGFVAFIPYIGFLIGATATIVLAINQFDNFNSVAVVIGALIVGQLLDANFITPRIIGQRLNLHPNIIILGLFVCVAVFGFAGAILALPLTSIFAVITRALTQVYKESDYYQKRHIQQ